MEKLCVLWIDDHIETYGPFKEELDRRGFVVLEAKCVNDAIKIIHQQKIDLVLLDLRLSNETGFDFLNKLKSKTNIPVCIFSSYLHLEDYQKRISNVRKNVAVLDKSLPDPKSNAFDIFSDKLRFIAKNPPQYRPSTINRQLSSNFLSKDPFKIEFREYLNLPSKVKHSIRSEAYKRAKATLEKEFKNGKTWILLCGSSDKPVKSLDEIENIPTSKDVTAIAMELNRVPYQFSAPDNLDDIQSSCPGAHTLSNYPTVTLKLGDKKLKLHFDTGSPWSFVSYEEVNELGILPPNLIETDGRRGYAKYEYYNDIIQIELVDQKAIGKLKQLPLSIRAVKNWEKSPFIVICPSGCETFGKVCQYRLALIGRNLIFENKLELTICGKTNKTSYSMEKSRTKRGM